MPVRFADVELDPDKMRLVRAGVEVPVEPQVFEVLAYLVAHRDRLVPKTELLDQIWGSRFVSESALSSRIKSARQAIGDNGRDQRMIRTVHGRGFRFAAEVEEASEPTGDVPHPQSAPRDVDGKGDVRAPDVPGRARWTPADLPAQVVAELRAGRGAAIEIVGPSASACAELLEDVLAAASAADILVGRGSGEVGSSGSSDVLAALDEWVQRRPELLDEIPPACAGELQAVLAGSEPSSRPRLAVCARELLVAAGRSGGAVIGIDRVHLVDALSIDLLTNLARSVRHVPVVVVIGHREGFRLDAPTHTVRLDPAAGATDEPIPTAIRSVLARAAVLGESIDPVELAAVADLQPDEVGRVLAEGIACGAVIADGHGYRFGDADVAAGLAASVPAPEQAALVAAAAGALEAAGASPARIAELHQRLGDVDAAGPHLVAAASEAAARQLPGHVLQLTDVVDEVRDPKVRQEMLELRADAGAALGQPQAIGWYRWAIRTAVPEQIPWLRVRLGRACLMASDLDGAREALDGVEPDGGPADGAILLVSGMIAYLDGDLDRAEALAEAARPYALAPGAPGAMLDVIVLQGMIAHSRGEWFDRLRRELRFATDTRDLASILFDSYICVSQFLLYGSIGHGELLQLAEELRGTAEAEGLRPATGFALTLIGEASLLSGDLDRAREVLRESVELHAAMGADTGHAHALQRLAEVELAMGNRAQAEQLARRSLTLARWSPLSAHLIQRVYGTLIAAAAEPAAAAEVVDEVDSIGDGRTACAFCEVTVAVPAAVALAGVGRFDEAHARLSDAARCAARWEGPAWLAAVDEAAGMVARHEGDESRARNLLAKAAAGFDAAGQVLDAARCCEALV